MKRRQSSPILTSCLLVLVFLAAGFSPVQAQYRKKTYTWKWKGKVQEMQVKLPETTYQHYRSKQRNYKYGSFVREDAGHELIPPLARGLKSKAEALALNEFERAKYIVVFVQSLAYMKETGEYPRYPVETLVDGGGDCEDTAILLSAILDALGYDVIMLSPPAHMAVGLAIKGYSGKYYTYEGKKYYYIETTGANWDIGEVPENYEGTASVYELYGVTGSRNALVFDGSTSPTPATPPSHSTVQPGELYVGFYKSREGAEGTYKGRLAYQYRVQVEGDAKTLSKVRLVQYRREHSTFPEYKTGAWLTATGSHENFKAEWTGYGHVPIRIRVVYRDGSTRGYRVNEAPMMAAM